MNKKRIIDYVLKAPKITNPAILSDMLDQLMKNKPVATAEELKEALSAGGEVVLMNDIKMNEEIIINKDTTLDLNGKEIIAEEAYTGWYLLKADGAKLTIDGKGCISAGASEKAIPVTSTNGAEVKILGGQYKCRGEHQCVYSNGGLVEIYGGTYSVVEGDTAKDLLNVQNTHQVTDIQVYGGTFIGRDPKLGDDALGGNFVAEGYESIEIKKDKFEVKKA